MILLLDQLKQLQNEIRQLVCAVPEADYDKQFHHDLSPIGWHLGHCVYTETYWVQEQLLNKITVANELKSIYVPELSIKNMRGAALPDRSELVAWSEKKQAENYALLEQAVNQSLSHPLLEAGYLILFLIQHYAQHIETILMIQTERQIQQANKHHLHPTSLDSNSAKKECVTIKSGSFAIGTSLKHAYDNEKPEHVIELQSFNIATMPVTNSEFLKFIESDVYTNKQFWSDTAWDWLNNSHVTHPHHWRQDASGNWYGIDHQGCFELQNDKPVSGLSHHEATAYATWVGARLPHEYEWEIASNTTRQLQQTAQVWEWCNNTFHPYTGFTPYPYTGYSSPYFDDAHYVLKGGSRYTKDCIKRPSFRNYYTADKRHIFAGLRLVYI